MRRRSKRQRVIKSLRIENKALIQQLETTKRQLLIEQERNRIISDTLKETNKLFLLAVDCCNEALNISGTSSLISLYNRCYHLLNRN
jgi:hypothetical protein